MSIRWNITDRATGKSLIVAHPGRAKEAAKERDNLATLIKNCSAIGAGQWKK